MFFGSGYCTGRLNQIFSTALLQHSPNCITDLPQALHLAHPLNKIVGIRTPLLLWPLSHVIQTQPDIGIHVRVVRINTNLAL